MNIDPADPAVLRGAAEVIKRDGLAKGNFTDNHAHCTVGALMAVKGCEDTFPIKAETRLLASMVGPEGRDPGSEWVDVSIWNDEPDRTPEDVILLLEQAAEKAEADQ